VEIKNKIAVITGASKGIGKTTALMLAKKGANLAISARSKDMLESVATECGPDTLAFTGDMSIEDDIKKFINETKKKFGRIDILINNAGLGIFKSISDISTQDWDTMFNLNVRGLFLATR